MKTSIPIAVTVAAVMAVSSFGMNSALAVPLQAMPSAVQNDAQLIQVASKKKHRRVHRNNAAGAAAVMGLFGVIGAIAAQDAYRDRYYGDGYYYGGGGPVYYNAPRYHHGGHYNRGHYNRGGDQRVYPRQRALPGSNVSPPNR